MIDDVTSVSSELFVFRVICVYSNSDDPKKYAVLFMRMLFKSAFLKCLSP